MSNYSKFLDDLEVFYRDRKAKGITEKVHPDHALAAVRNNWMEKGKLKELISFIHTNWDSGNCDDFIAPFEDLLINTKQSDLFKQLWTKIIKYRLAALWSSVDDLRSQSKKIVVAEIASIDTFDFNMFSKESYKDLKRVVSFRRRFAIEGLTKMMDGLLRLGDTDEASTIKIMIDDVTNLKRSNLKV